MGYQVAICKKETGEIFLCNFDFEWSETDEAWWLSGNNSCDCNRELTFERAKGNDPHFEDAECSDGKYIALYAIVNGEKIPLEEN